MDVQRSTVQRRFFVSALLVIVSLILLAGCLSQPTPENLPQSETPSHSHSLAIAPLETSFPATPLPTSTPFSDTPAGSHQSETQIQLYSIDAKSVSLPIEGSIVIDKALDQLSLGEQYLFVSGIDPGDGITRINLETKKTEPFLDSYFKNGALGMYRIIWRRPWLIFLDVDSMSSTFHWVVRAYNVETKESRDVLEVQDDISWPGPDYSFDGQHLAVSYGAYDSDRKCESSYLWVFNVQDPNKDLLIDAHCSEYGPFIWGPVKIHDDILVAEQDLPQNQGSVNKIVFYKRDVDNKWHIYHREEQGYNSMPAMSWPWLVWKDGERYDYGRKNKAYNFATGERLFIRVPRGDAYDPQMCNEWVIWTTVDMSSSQSGIDGSAYFYRLPSGPFVKFSKTTKLGGGFGRFSCLPNGEVAWLYDIGGQTTLVEWGKLPDPEQ